MGEKFWVKSHNFSQGQRDLREWSLLIGWDEWSHDFGVRFDWNAHHGVVCTTWCARTPRRARAHDGMVCAQTMAWCARTPRCCVHMTAWCARTQVWCAHDGAHDGVVCMHTMAWCMRTQQCGVHTTVHTMAWCAHTWRGVHAHNSVVCTQWRTRRCGVHAHDSVVCTRWRTRRCGMHAHNGVVYAHTTVWCARTQQHGVHANERKELCVKPTGFFF